MLIKTNIYKKNIVQNIIFISVLFLLLKVYPCDVNIAPKSLFVSSSIILEEANAILEVLKINDSIEGNSIFGKPVKDWIKKHGVCTTPVLRKDRIKSVDDHPYAGVYAFIIRDSNGIEEAKKRIIGYAKIYFDDSKVNEIENALKLIQLKHLKIAKSRFRPKNKIKKFDISNEDEKKYRILQSIANEVAYPPLYLTKGFEDLYYDFIGKDIPLWKLKIWIVDEKGRIDFEEMEKWVHSESKRPTLLWFKALNEGRVKSFEELFINNIGFVNQVKQKESKKFVPYVWIGENGINVRKKGEIHVFKTLFDAVRSSFIHEIDSIISDLKILRKADNILSLMLMDMSLKSKKVSITKAEIENIKKTIGTVYNNLWGESKKKTWESLDYASSILDYDFLLESSIAYASLNELKIDLEKLIGEKKKMLFLIRQGRIEALIYEINNRNEMFKKHIRSMEVLLNEKKFTELKSKLGHLLSMWAKYNREPDFLRMNNTIGLLQNIFSTLNPDLDKAKSLISVIKKHIDSSSMLYDFFLQYTDLKINAEVHDKVIFDDEDKLYSYVFNRFVVKYSLFGNDARDRAVFWAKFYQHLYIPFIDSEKNGGNLYEATAKFIRIIEYANSLDVLLNKKSFVNKLEKTRGEIQKIFNNRNKLLREDLPFIAKSLSSDMNLTEDESNKLFKCILKEERSIPIKINDFREAA